MENLLDTTENKICKGDHFYHCTIGRETFTIPRYNHHWELKDAYKSFNVYECTTCGIIRKVITKY